ncbi:MAG: hypothetical protein ACSW8I_02760 [bacterium]
MLRLFEKNTLLQVVIILAVMAILWVPAFGSPIPMTPPDGFAPLYSLVYSIGLSPWVSLIIAIILILLGGVFLNLLLVNVGLVSQNSLLPTFLYILLMSAGADTLYPTMIVSTLAIVMVNLLMLRSTHLTIPSNKIFGAAAIIGICTLFYLPSIALIFTYILVAISYRLYSWRDWIVFLLGLLAPYIPVWAVLFFTDGITNSFDSMANTFSAVSIHIGETGTLQSIANITLLFLFFISLFVLWSRLSECTIVWKKNASTVMLITVAALAMLPYSSLLPFNLHFIAIPDALCTSLWLASANRRRSNSHRKWSTHLYDLILVVILIAALLC